MHIKIKYILLAILVCLFSVSVQSLADPEAFSKKYVDTLTVYGNANMDDIIDETDIEYVKGIINGNNQKTQFADANLDNIINDMDISQIRHLIDGDADEINILDMSDRVVTVPLPVERIVSASCYDSTRTLILLDIHDKIVGCSFPGSKFSGSSIQEAAPELANLPDPGNRDDINVELVLSLKPDVIFVSTKTNADEIQEKTNVPTIVVTAAGDLWVTDMLRIIGAVTGEDKRARELIDYAKEKIEDITKITSKIPNNEKLIIYNCGPGGGTGDMSAICRSSMDKALVEKVGGLVPTGTGEIITGGVQVSKEQVIKWNPDVITIHGGNAKEINTILSDPDLQSINAVKNGKVYSLKVAENGSGILGEMLAELGYLAKLLYPDKFEHLNVEKNGNEIMKYTYGVDGLYTALANAGDFYQW